MQDVVVDACCLINFHAGGVLSQIGACEESESEHASNSLGYTLHAPPQVLRETLFLFRPDQSEDGKGVQEPIDLNAYVSARVLHECTLTVEETALFVDFAIRLDDGEAACLAVAKVRGWVLATDDRKGAKIAAENGVTVVTTPEMVKQWADKSGVSEEEVKAAIEAIESCASFRPRKASDLYSWWIGHLERER